MDEKFAINLLRMSAACAYFEAGLAAAREMFGKSYFALGAQEKTVVDQTVFGHVQTNYISITPEMLEGQQGRQPMGFPIQGPSPTAGRRRRAGKLSTPSQPAPPQNLQPPLHIP
jgi:hypothetical protein